MNQLELDTEYGGIFSSALSATLGLAPLVGTLGVKAISTGLKWYKKVKVREQGVYMKFSQVPFKNLPITSPRPIPRSPHPRPTPTPTPYPLKTPGSPAPLWRPK